MSQSYLISWPHWLASKMLIVGSKTWVSDVFVFMSSTKSYVFCERLGQIGDTIILIVIPPLSSAIGGDDNEKV